MMTEVIKTRIAALLDGSYLGLLLADGNEASAFAGYKRMALAWSVDTTNGLTISNLTDITFPLAQSLWGQMVGIAIFDKQIAGEKLWEMALDTPTQIGRNDQIRFPAGQIVINIGEAS